MPTLPLPTGDVPIGGGTLPVSTTEDVAAVEDDLVNKPETARVRDALRAGQSAMFQEWQRRSEQAAGQGDPERATGTLLLGQGSDRSFFRQDGESEEAFRARISAPLQVVTPNAILAIANAVLAPFTDVECKYFESILDRGYTNDGTPQWHAFVRADAETQPVSPTYLSRLYPADEAINGGAIAAREVPGFFTFSDGGGRFFVLRVPLLAGLGNDFTSDGTKVTLPSGDIKVVAFWTQNGSGSQVISTVTSGGDAKSVYQAVANAVNGATGHSIRWQLIVDAGLT